MGTFLFLLLSITSTQQIVEIRNLFEEAVYSEEKAKLCIEKLSNTNNQLLLGYKGAVTMMMAKYYFSPLKKLDSFNSGKELLEAAIKNSPANVELIYLRFTIQTNTPSFLDYRKNIHPDKALLLTEVKTITDKDLQKRIVNYLLKSTQVNEKEKSDLRKIQLS